MPSVPQEYFSIPEAAKYMGVSVSTINNLIRPGFKMIMNHETGKREKVPTGRRPVLTAYHVADTSTLR